MSNSVVHPDTPLRTPESRCEPSVGADIMVRRTGLSPDEKPLLNLDSSSFSEGSTTHLDKLMTACTLRVASETAFYKAVEQYQQLKPSPTSPEVQSTLVDVVHRMEFHLLSIGERTREIQEVLPSITSNMDRIHHEVECSAKEIAAHVSVLDEARVVARLQIAQPTVHRPCVDPLHLWNHEYEFGEANVTTEFTVQQDSEHHVMTIESEDELPDLSVFNDSFESISPTVSYQGRLQQGQASSSVVCLDSDSEQEDDKSGIVRIPPSISRASEIVVLDDSSQELADETPPLMLPKRPVLSDEDGLRDQPLGMSSTTRDPPDFGMESNSYSKTSIENIRNRDLLARTTLIGMVEWPQIRDNSYVDMRATLLNFESLVAVLPQLGCNITIWEPVLVCVLKSKFGPTLLQGWDKHAKLVSARDNYDVNNSWASIISFVQLQQDILQAKPRTDFSTNLYPDGLSERDTRFKTKPVQPQCPVCTGTRHPLYMCSVFRCLSMKERINAVKKHKNCFNCLSEKHAKNACISENVCLKCGEKHHTLLHGDPGSESTLANSRMSLGSSSSTQTGNSSVIVAPTFANVDVLHATPAGAAERKNGTENDPLQGISHGFIDAKVNDADRSNGMQVINNYVASSVATAGIVYQQPANLIGQNARVNSFACHGTCNSKQLNGSASRYHTGTILSTAYIRAINNDGNVFNVRALIDNGAMINAITASAASKLGLKISHSGPRLSGLGGIATKERTGLTKICISLAKNYGNEMWTFIVVPEIVKQLPLSPIPVLPDLHSVHWAELSDPTFDTPGPIDMLIGVEKYNELLLDRRVKEGTLYLQDTKIGWIVSGTTHYLSDTKSKKRKATQDEKHSVD